MKKRQRMKNQAKDFKKLQLGLDHETEVLAAKCQATNQYVEFANQQAEMTIQHLKDIRESITVFQNCACDMATKNIAKAVEEVKGAIFINGKNQITAQGLEKMANCIININKGLYEREQRVEKAEQTIKVYAAVMMGLVLIQIAVWLIR